MNRGHLIWITGLSGSGKTTLALALSQRFKREGLNHVLLDGDCLRRSIGSNAQGDVYAREQRLRLALQYARLCHRLTRRGLTVICATISLFHRVQFINRQRTHRYTEVCLKCPQETLLRRDRKGLYRKALDGLENQVVGYGIAAEWPIHPELVLCNSETSSIEAMCQQLWQSIHCAN